MKTIITAALVLAMAVPTVAGAHNLGETNTAGGGTVSAADDTCMLNATVRASYSNARDEEIYGIARKLCGYARRGQDTVDIEQAAAWTNVVAGLRERRHRQDAMYGLREIASR